MESLRYIYDKAPPSEPPGIDRYVIEILAQLIEANRPDSRSQAVALIQEIQLAHSWVLDIHAEKKIGGATQLAALHCLLLYARCMKWYDFSRGNKASIEEEVSYDDIKTAIHFLRARTDMTFLENSFEVSELSRTIRAHFGKYEPESNPSGSDNLF
jgi:hypothetical protein